MRRLFVCLVTACVVGFFAASVSAEEITICVKKESGKMRIVDGPEECDKSEYEMPLPVGLAGPAGPTGPAGQDGTCDISTTEFDDLVLRVAALEEAIHKENLLKNGNFESWTDGPDSPPDFWTEIGDLNSPFIFVTRTPVRYEGNYAVLVGDDFVAGNFCLQQVVYSGGLPEGIKGKTLELSVWTRRADGSGLSRAEIAISDGITRTTTAADDTWHYNWQHLSVTHSVSASAPELIVELCPVPNGGHPAEIARFHFDSAVLQ